MYVEEYECFVEGGGDEEYGAIGADAETGHGGACFFGGGGLPERFVLAREQVPYAL